MNYYLSHSKLGCINSTSLSDLANTAKSWAVHVKQEMVIRTCDGFPCLAVKPDGSVEKL